MSLDPKDIELIERLIYKNADDVAVAISRSFERLEERIDAGESRLYSRIGDVDDRMDNYRQDIVDTLGEIKEVIRDEARFKEEADVFN